MSHVIWHHLTQQALQDLLVLLNALLPDSVPATKYKFLKAFDCGLFQVKFLAILDK